MNNFEDDINILFRTIKLQWTIVIIDSIWHF